MANKTEERKYNRAAVRWTWLAIMICVSVSQTGCQMLDRFRVNTTPAPIAFTATPSQQELFGHLNQQSAKVQQLKTNVRVSMAGMPSLRGTLTIERPRRFRLKAGLMGVSEMGVDVGSNDEYFWIWTKASLPGQTPTMYFASHVAYEQSQIQQVIPIKPEWIVDALGLIDDRPGDRHSIPVRRPDGWLQVDTYRQTESGGTVRRNLIDAKTGLVHQQSIYDSHGNLLAFANSLKHQFYPDPGISLPQRVELSVLQSGAKTMKLTINADEHVINSLYGDPDKLWSMPNPMDVRKINLSQVNTSPDFASR